MRDIERRVSANRLNGIDVEHIFVADAADYYSIHDGLPQHDDRARMNMTYFEE